MTFYQQGGKVKRQGISPKAAALPSAPPPSSLALSSSLPPEKP